MNSRILGIIGAILLIVGIFLPIVSVFGINLSYFDSFRMNSGAVDGLIIAGLGVISLILAALNKTRILIATAILALGVMAIDFFSFKSKMSEATSAAASNPELANLVQLQWGWGVLLLGALLLLVAGIMKKSGPAPVPQHYGAPPPPPYNPGQPPPPPPYNR